MPGDTCDRTRAHQNTCKIPSTSGKLPMSTSMLTVQSHIPHRNSAVAATTLATVTFCLHSSALSCFILNETFGMLQQQETLYFGYTNLGSRVQVQAMKSNRLCRKECTCNVEAPAPVSFLHCLLKHSWLEPRMIKSLMNFVACYSDLLYLKYE